MPQTKIRFRSALLVLGLTLALGQASWAQSTAVVETNDADAHVYADSTWLGLAGLRSFAIPQGAQNIRVVPSGVGVWGIATISVPIGRRVDTTRVVAQFPYAYRLDATPVGADIYRVVQGQRTYFGVTPKVSLFDSPLEGKLSFEKQGFATVEVPAGDAFWNRHMVEMRPVAGESSAQSDFQLDMPRRSRRWIEYVSVGAALAGGILAVHYKIKADNRFDVYQETGDPALRPRIEHFDNRSAWALGAMQAGVGVFAIRLALR